MLAASANPASPFFGALDASRIGMSGHSFGGFTTLALAAGANADPRLGAFMPLAPGGPFPTEFFRTITAPILFQGGSLDTTTPFDSQQQAPFDGLPAGALVVGLAEIVGAGHFSFSDICEVPRNLVGLIGGFDEACEPRHLPWRRAHEIVNYLAENFFEATLSGDKAALKRLKPRTVASIPDVDYQRK
jgi:predicted dienelactone hydrolase